MTDATMPPLVAKLWEEIGHYSIECASSGELAPSPQLVSAIDAVSSAIAAVAEDAARLDWLDKEGGKNVFQIGHTWYSRAGYQQPNRKRKNLRDAIDNARGKKQ